MNLHQILSSTDKKFFVAYGVNDEHEASIFVIESTPQHVESDMHRMRDMMYEVMCLENIHTYSILPGWIETADQCIESMRADYGVYDDEDDSGGY